MNKAKKIFYKDGMQSHSALAEHFKLDEDKLLKVDYDWRAKTLDIWGDNEDQNSTCSFRVNADYYDAAENFVEKKVGTKKKLMKWLSNNTNDKKIKKVIHEVLHEDIHPFYFKSIKKKPFDWEAFRILFRDYPNRAWSL